jgi:hypothetical protein
MRSIAIWEAQETMERGVSERNKLSLSSRNFPAEGSRMPANDLKKEKRDLARARRGDCVVFAHHATQGFTLAYDEIPKTCVPVPAGGFKSRR